jgi:hypothetical protein
MPIEPADRQRLAKAMEERMLALNLTWQEVALAGGISLRAIASARTGPGDIRPRTRRGIDKGLQWLEGHGVDNILAGRMPLPALLDNIPPRVEKFARDLGVDPADPADPVLTPLRGEIDDAEAVHGEDADGAQVFSGQPWSGTEAVLWDDRGLGREAKIVIIATTRAERVRYEAGRNGTRHRGTAGLALAAVTARGS